MQIVANGYVKFKDVAPVSFAGRWFHLKSTAMGTLWEKLVRPGLFALDAERAHEIAVNAMKLGFSPRVEVPTDSKLGPLNRFGLEFPNPLGIAAGFDKNGVVVDRLADLGFGFVEAGTVTLRPQPGNPRPRLFRLPVDRALINRLGFNNNGAADVAQRIGRSSRRCVVGINIGRNKDVPPGDEVENYVACLETVHAAADYIAVNVSSPNTPGLRELQRAENLDSLLSSLQVRNQELGPKPLLVKIAPDLGDSDLEAIVDIARSHGIAGVIATNTTITRSGLVTGGVEELGPGGLSGRPIANLSTRVISSVYKYARGRLPIVGVGGVFTAADAFEKIAAGASLVQAYTGFVYGGPYFARDVLRGLASILDDRGFPSLDSAIGSAVR